MKLRLAALPIEGRANAALCAWLAQSLALPGRAVRIVRGESSRTKQVSIDLPLAQVSAWLGEVLLAAEPSTKLSR